MKGDTETSRKNGQSRVQMANYTRWDTHLKEVSLNFSWDEQWLGKNVKKNKIATFSVRGGFSDYQAFLDCYHKKAEW